MLVILIKGLCTRGWIKSLRLAYSVAAGIIPELLPAIVNTVLKRGALLLFKNTASVQRPDSVQNLDAFSVLCSDKVWILPSSAWLSFGAISATQLPVQIYCSASLYPILGNLLMKNISWSLNRDELRISSDSCSYWSSNEYYWLANILSQLVLLLPTVRYAYQGHRGIPVRLVSSRDFAPNPHSSHPSHYQTPSTRTHSAKSV